MTPFYFVPAGKEGEPVLLEMKGNPLTPEMLATAFNELDTCIVKTTDKDKPIFGTTKNGTNLVSFGVDVLFEKKETPVTIYLLKQPVGIVNWKDNPKA